MVHNHTHMYRLGESAPINKRLEYSSMLQYYIVPHELQVLYYVYEPYQFALCIMNRTNLLCIL